MKQSRCPWCGKELRRHKIGIERFKFNLSIVHLCSQCSGSLSSWFSSVIWVILLALLISVYLHVNLSLLLIIFVPALALYVLALFFVKPRLHKIGDDGKRSVGERRIFYGTVESDGDVELRRGQILLTDKEFDNQKAYSVSSPIIIDKYDKSSKMVKFEFMYENECTSEIINGGLLKAYQDGSYQAISILLKNT